ncbi:adenylate cyclase [Arthroderma uncinatum]|uniref:adenylate cyclase n=1 Tax=Arthroderma uncinatum TaxID=74035 RepID=UPI00144A98A3|nr:adenylate cyclase [Arthroderma uncinatum]KAF3492308.1 adenylate cyclase [Arthroderma uncinatum]
MQQDPNRYPDARHGSETSSTGSRRSQDTVKQDDSSSQARPIRRYGGDGSDSFDAGATIASAFPTNSPNISPKERRTSYGFGNPRKVLNMISHRDGLVPPGKSTIPKLAPVSHGPSATSSPKFPSDGNQQRTFFHDSPELESSPSFEPFTAHGLSNSLRPDEDDDDGDNLRRPSIASATTIGSQGSRSSGGRFHKRLQGIFGDEFEQQDPSFPSHPRSSSRLSSSRPRTGSAGRARQGSTNSLTLDRGTSPDPARPRTPIPSSSEVTPWEYQNFTDIPNLGEAPVRQAPTDTIEPQTGTLAPKIRPTHRLHHLTGHRHTQGKEDTPITANISSPIPSRPASGRDEIPALMRPSREHSLQAPTPMSSSTTLGGRSASPTPSTRSINARDARDQPSPGPSAPKRSFFDRIRRHKAPINSLKNLPLSSKSVQETGKAPSYFSAEPGSSSRVRKGSSESTSRQWENNDSDRRKESSSKGLAAIGPSRLRHGRRHFMDGKDRRNKDENDHVFLDTNLGDMSGIVTHHDAISPTDTSIGIFAGPKSFSANGEALTPLETVGTDDWHPPDSWQVKRPADEGGSRLSSVADAGPEMDVDVDGHPFCIRVFRIDSTFATLSASLNTTVTQLLEMLGRKSFLQEDLNNYEIVMRKNDLSRTLEPGERPIMMQKRLLQQVGYHMSDRITEIGREDNSYICRFTFLPTKLGVYSNLDPELGFTDNQKYSHVDLEGRSVATIPLKLYKKASEIISLNLSKNLALDVPKDFIQSCINLREIRFTSNEAWHLPPSLSLATRLTYLDISNNRLEKLEHANLHMLKGLVSLKMANNKLSSLPADFWDFPSLRSLNLSSNNFRVLPDFLGNLNSLVDLDISFNQIEDLPTIGQFTSLERLWVTNNSLSGPLVETFKGLTKLKEVDARFNNITAIDNMSSLPRLETLLVGHNAVSAFSGSFARLRTLVLDHCPVTEFDITSPLPTLHSLNIASAKLVEFRDSLFTNVPNLTKLILNTNHFVTLSPNIGSLKKLEHLNLAKNPLSILPASIGCLTELKNLNLRECNLNRLPAEIWYCLKLESLNVSSNVLEMFPKPATSPPLPPSEVNNGLTPMGTPLLRADSHEEVTGRMEDYEFRRPSHASSSRLQVGTPPDPARKGSIPSMHSPSGRKSSNASRATAESRKDSTFSQRIASTFANSLRQLYLADNLLEDDIFHQIALLTELRVLNMSYNGLTDLPSGFIRRLQYLTELYLSGNELSSLPSDDLEESSNLKVLHLNGNKFQVLPAELCKINKLAVLDVGSNSLKYNISNWPYDWNWNWNHNLRYLNFSGNKRFGINPSSTYTPSIDGTPSTDLTDFSSLSYIRVLGLMDVTLTIPTIPEETEDRRVRTSASLSGYIAYGLADSLGRNEHLSMIDMVVPRFRGSDMETIIGLFDGQPSMGGGSKIAKFLHENFTSTFMEELGKLRKQNGETPEDALRRTFLALNKDMATAAYKPVDDKESRHWDRNPTAAKLLNREDAFSGGIATVLYLQNMELFVANVGDAQALLVQGNGQFKYLTKNHDPAETSERERIREAGGYVSRNGKLNDQLSVSRAFGHFHLVPAVIAAPSTVKITLTSQDEMIILASGQLWDYVTPNVVVDVARSERGDLMIASQKIRDLAISYGATSKLMVMIAGVNDLKRRERSKFRSTSLSRPSPLNDEHMFPLTKRARRGRDIPSDSTLARLGHVEAPTGELAIVFTDIKQSTSLWETYPLAMRSAIQIHNELFRRQLRLIGGFEVKTEGDAFMVSFSTATAALLWCFTCQMQLLEAHWPTEVLQTPSCRETYDDDGNLIYRGLSVRMGMHWGRPLCEKDPVTGRMDYFGPMVNRASRISAVADGGQIFVSADFVTEMERTLEAFADYERTNSESSEDTFGDDALGQATRRELYQLSTQGFEVKDLGERKLKGLENPESVYLLYPHALSGRLSVQPDMMGFGESTSPGTLGKNSTLNIDADMFWQLLKVALRLEAFCSALENPAGTMLIEPDLQLINAIKARSDEIDDTAVMNLLEHQVARIETCTNTLTVRAMMQPFKPNDTILDHAVPMSDILQQLQSQLAEFRALKTQISLNGGPTTPPPSGYSLEMPESTISSAQSSTLNLTSPSSLAGRK